MKINKKIMSVCLVAAMTGSAVMPAWASPEFARSAEEWEKLRDNTLEYGELEGLIQEYNTTVLNNRTQYNKTKSNERDDITDQYWQRAQKNYDRAAEAAEAEDLEAALLADQAARLAEGQAEANASGNLGKWLGYEKAEKQLVMQAQTAMNTYYQQGQSLIALRKNRDLAQASYESAQLRQSISMATAAEVLDAQQSVQALDAQILGMESQIESTRQKLIVMTGWSAEATPEITVIPAVDVSRVAALNLNEDMVKALEQDYTLRIDTDKLNRAISMENTEMLQQTVNNHKQQISVAVNTAYQNVMQAKAAYDQAALDLDVASKKLNTANIQYNQLQNIAKLEYLKQEADFVTAQTNMRIKDLALLQALESYDWIIKGVR